MWVMPENFSYNQSQRISPDYKTSVQFIDIELNSEDHVKPGPIIHLQKLGTPPFVSPGTTSDLPGYVKKDEVLAENYFCHFLPFELNKCFSLSPVIFKTELLSNSTLFHGNPTSSFTTSPNFVELLEDNRKVSDAKGIWTRNSSQAIDPMLCNLNLNNLSLKEVNYAMGVDGHSHAISPEKEVYYRKIFDKLDIDKDGRLDVEDLKQAYREMGLLQVPGQAEKFVTASDSNNDGELDVTEFVRYLHEHEMKLRLMFTQMDLDKDGRITCKEIEEALRSVGFEVSKDEVNEILRRMDKDSTSSIDLDEWIEHHLLHPSADIRDIVSYWKHGTYIDIGESLIVPDDFSEAERVSGLWWRQLVAGGVAGIVSRTCTAPLDRLKVLLQVHASKANRLGVLTGFRSMLREGGVRSLWRGNGINVLKIAPETAVKFFAYEKMKQLIGTQSKTEIGAPEKFLAGSTAGVISQTVIYPMEVIKTRLALRKTGQYSGIFDCAYKILRCEGPSAFFKGYIPNSIGVIPYAGIDLCIYETLKNYWIKRYGAKNEKPSVPLLLACGTVSSTCGQLASYPLALVRTKMQAQVPSSQNSEKLTMVSLFRNIVHTDGLFGLYRGLAPNFMKVTLQMNFIKRFLTKKNVGAKVLFAHFMVLVVSVYTIFIKRYKLDGKTFRRHASAACNQPVVVPQQSPSSSANNCKTEP